MSRFQRWLRTDFRAQGLHRSRDREIYCESLQGITGVSKANFILLDVRFLFA
jgi:hypothetical protein